jgi:pilus assembly protein CpaC
VAQFLDSLQGNDAAIEVLVNRSKLLTTRKPLDQGGGGVPVIAISDPTIADFDILPDSRMIRLIGHRVGVTDLMFVTADGQSYSFAIHVVYDLDLLRAHLKQIFPDALIRLGQIREHLVVEGQARSNAQVDQILDAIEAYLASAQLSRSTTSTSGDVQLSAASRGQAAEQPPAEKPPADETAGEGTGPNEAAEPGQPGDEEPGVAYEEGDRPNTSATFAAPRIINLLTVPGVKQVMLKVQIAELNRTALRQIGTDLFAEVGNNQLASFAGAFGGAGEGVLTGSAGTLIGIFDSGNFTMIMRALRSNNVATILAEPNLVTLDGHEASFLSGGQFPVPVAQQGGGAGNNSVEFKDFGVQLGFVPYILDEGVIRLHVEPEVSNVSEDLAVSLIAGGSPVPGLRSRNAATTVELRQGQTLAIAGLLSREVGGSTTRIPLLGDLPYVGPLFASTSHEVVEQELLVAVTPYLVSPMSAGECLNLPGQEILEPNDLELYLLNRIEGRTGYPHRSTTQWDNPFHRQTQMQVEQQYFLGPIGLSE